MGSPWWDTVGSCSRGIFCGRGCKERRAAENSVLKNQTNQDTKRAKNYLFWFILAFMSHGNCSGFVGRVGGGGRREGVQSENVQEGEQEKGYEEEKEENEK